MTEAVVPRVRVALNEWGVDCVDDAVAAAPVELGDAPSVFDVVGAGDIDDRGVAATDLEGVGDQPGDGCGAGDGNGSMYGFIGAGMTPRK